MSDSMMPADIKEQIHLVASFFAFLFSVSFSRTVTIIHLFALAIPLAEPNAWVNGGSEG
jgi:hypothetical protein